LGNEASVQKPLATVLTVILISPYEQDWIVVFAAEDAVRDE
jgi:hypothetical protein